MWRATQWLPIWLEAAIKNLANIFAAGANRRQIFGGLLGLGLFAPSASVGQRTSVPQTRAPANSQNGDFSGLAARVLPMVVGISATRHIAGQSRHGRAADATATGSGFFIATDGVIVTNNHVVAGASAIMVETFDGHHFPARLLGADPQTDIAVLKVTGTGFAAGRWGDDRASAIGAWVMAVGSPFGLGHSVSVGIISGRGRNIDAGRYDDFIQTDAAINRGNSGGPLFNARGEVIGINTAILSNQIAQGGSVGVGFAIPAYFARRIADDLARFGHVRRGWIGLMARDDGPNVNQPRARIIVSAIVRSGPAGQAGIHAGDQIIALNGRSLANAHDLARQIGFVPPGQSLSLTIQNQSGRRAVTVVSANSPNGNQNLNDVVSVFGFSLMGRPQAQAIPIIARVWGRGAPPTGANVIISGVDPFGRAHGQLLLGDAVLAINGRTVADVGAARAAIMAAARQNGRASVRLWRGGQVITRILILN